MGGAGGGAGGGRSGGKQQQQQRSSSTTAVAAAAAAARAQRVKAPGGFGLEMPKINVPSAENPKTPGAGSLFWAKVACSEHRHSGGVSRPSSVI